MCLHKMFSVITMINVFKNIITYTFRQQYCVLFKVQKIHNLLIYVEFVEHVELDMYCIKY